MKGRERSGYREGAPVEGRDWPLRLKNRERSGYRGGAPVKARDWLKSLADRGQAIATEDAHLSKRETGHRD